MNVDRNMTDPSATPSPVRITTTRLPAEQADQVEFVARVEGKAASEFIREAIAAYLATYRADPAFQQRLKERIDADARILDRLKDG